MSSSERSQNPDRTVAERQVASSSLYRLYELCSLLFEQFFDRLLNLFTRKSKLQRLLESRPPYKAISYTSLERCIGQNRIAALKYPDELDRVLEENGVKTEDEYGEVLKERLADAVLHLNAYKDLIDQVESIRTQSFNSGNPLHEAKLKELWSLCCPDEELPARTGKHWTRIGFQGEDPSTDFRGMGILSLDQLIFFALQEPADFTRIFHLQAHHTLGFPMAVAGINMTALVRDLLTKGRLKNHFYNSIESPPDLVAFHRVYCRVFSLFVDAWLAARPSSVMQFNVIRQKFESRLEKYLTTNAADLELLDCDQLGTC